ncbi:MAG: 4'-phosphopantetheinyl transferase superfamily protein [Clostridia bacterium]|nr:4'-phosphopantetheinyl transferase superfamily protein [Clostridia bacterium]
MEKTETMLKDALNSLSESLEFEFCLVNMMDFERRLEKDLSLLSVLTEKETDYLNNLKINKNKIQWISGRYAVKSALFRHKLSESTIVNTACIDVLKGPDSAPYLSQYPELCVSITHSFPYCIGIVAKNKFGVDIEKIFKPEDSLIEHFYSENEKGILNCFKGTEEYSKKAMVFWTRKEAASKVFKQGMKLDFKGLDTSRDRAIINCCNIHFKSIVCNDFCVSIAFEDGI